ncbi:TIM-barrel domain-containing protein [Acidicapsa dinghuensis]|uniref:TIM-barrel domain-containing protein n=1 Tax=Acidicapsa dinghuensis TaxID=2218256 RepID=A0ABW1EMM3_9BACT|nr:TIM-barrel domain-containing protein [Acidicapsa dinghuensis]
MLLRRRSQYASWSFVHLLSLTLPVLVSFGFTIRSFAAESAAGHISLDRVTNAHALPNGVEIRSGSAIMQITALRKDLLRVRIGATETLPEDASWAVLAASRTAQSPTEYKSDEHSVGFSTGDLVVTIERNPLLMTVKDAQGNVIVQDIADRPIEFHGNSFRVYKQSPEDEHYFGLGDKPGPLDRRNEAFVDWNTDAFGWQESTDPIYKSIPWFMTFRHGIAGGIFLDNTWRTTFDFDKEVRDGYSFGADNGPLDYYIFYGPSPKQVEEEWAWLVGTVPLPPMWTLGFQQSRYSYYPQSEVERIAHTLREDRIPADAIYLDIDYQFKYWPFTVDPKRFPHFDDMIRELHAEHIRTVLITDLHIAKQPNQNYKPYDEGIAGDHFVKNSDGSIYTGVVWPGPAVFPDFTQKSSRDWWGTLYSDFVQKGIAGFWNDMNEPAIFEVASKTMPDDTQHRIEEPGFKTRTATHLEIHNVFGMENSRGTYEGLRKLDPNVRPFVLTRASYAGGHRYAATWTGDNSSTWNHLRQTGPQLMNLGLSGFGLAGADVGGFAGSPQPDLLTKWIEVAAFQPIDRDHTSMGTYPQEPWENGTTEDLNVRRRFIETRYRLMSYLYTTAEEMSRTGIPIMRPLFLEFPNASKDRHPLDLNTNNEFLVGPDLLIAPSPYPDMRDDYQAVLPPVGWYDFWTGEQVPMKGLEAQRVGNDNVPDNDLQINLHPSIDMLPVFARAGSIIPIQPLVESTDIKPSGPLTLRVYPPARPGGECSGSLYLDDGISYAYQKGDFLRLKFSCERTATGVTVKISPREGSYTPWWTQFNVEIYGADKPAASATSSLGAVQAAYDSEHHRLTVVIADDGKAAELSVIY